MKKRVNAKRKGLRREREARKIYEKEGYYVCPAKGSLGPFDFVAVAKDWSIIPQVRAVQVKSNKIYGKERKKVEGYEVCATKEICVKMNYRPWLRCRWNNNVEKWELL